MAINAGLVSVWHMNSDWLDSVGANDGTATGATFNTVDQKLGSAAGSFDALDDIVRVADDSSLSFGSAMSCLCWVKGSAQSLKLVAAQYDTTNQRSWFLSTGASSTNKLRVLISSTLDLTAGTYKIYESSVVAFDNTWHQVGFTFGSSTLKLYIDGSEDTSVSKEVDGSMSTIADSTADLTFGAGLTSGAPSGTYYGGLVDELALFNQEKSAADISEYRNGGAGIELPISTGPAKTLMMMGI